MHGDRQGGPGGGAASWWPNVAQAAHLSWHIHVSDYMAHADATFSLHSSKLLVLPFCPPSPSCCSDPASRLATDTYLDAIAA